jgi:hypothetical protein
MPTSPKEMSSSRLGGLNSNGEFPDLPAALQATPQGVEMKIFRLKGSRKRRVAVAVLVIAGSVAGVAIAAWTTGGSGSGQASAGTASSMAISAGTPSSSLYPTASADVAASVSNPNPYKVHVSSIALGAVTVDGGHSGCNTASVTVTSPQDNGGSGWDVPAKSGGVNGTLALDLANAISMSNAANDSCQGATFTIALTATGASTN